MSAGGLGALAENIPSRRLYPMAADLLHSKIEILGPTSDCPGVAPKTKPRATRPFQLNRCSMPVVAAGRVAAQLGIMADLLRGEYFRHSKVVAQVSGA